MRTHLASALMLCWREIWVYDHFYFQYTVIGSLCICGLYYNDYCCISRTKFIITSTDKIRDPSKSDSTDFKTMLLVCKIYNCNQFSSACYDELELESVIKKPKDYKLLLKKTFRHLRIKPLSSIWQTYF